jgi:hypothetical protein
MSMGVASAQAPTDNPHKNLYPNSKKHWTKKIHWDNVVDAKSVEGLIKPNAAVDSTLFAQTVGRIASQGGGVLYFKKGSYFFSFDVTLKNGVVLRGDPSLKSRPVSDNKFVLPTKFIFPRYEVGAPIAVDANFEEEMGTTGQPRSISSGKAVVKNSGLVNLDINRAVISFVNDTPKPLEKNQLNSNLVFLGLRLNNAALPDPAIPTAFQKEQKQVMQRWPSKDFGNINLTALRNVIIANCLINDDPSDNFRQNSYMIDDGMTFDGFEAIFKFSDHPCILINQPLANSSGKTLKTDKIEIFDNKMFFTKGNEPILFSGTEMNSRGNTMNALREKDNVVIAGITADRYPYDLLYDSPDATTTGVYTNHLNDDLPYRVMAPKSTDSNTLYPLVLSLHDYQSKGNDNKKQLRHFVWQFGIEEVQSEFPCYVLAPQLPESENFWKARYNFAFTWSMQACVDIIDEMIAKYPIDTNRIYLVGIGIGGDAIYDLGMNYPDKFAALASFGSYYRLSKRSSAQLAHFPMWLAWGDSDEWISREQKRIMTFDLRLAGAKVKTLELEETGKKCWNNLLAEAPEFIPWLFSQQKNNLKN